MMQLKELEKKKPNTKSVQRKKKQQRYQRANSMKTWMFLKIKVNKTLGK
jgi:hypothetical protein